MTQRRQFLSSSAAAILSGISFPALRLPGETAWLAQKPPPSAGEEDFWNWVHHAFTVSPNIINLNNGGVCPQPKVVQEALETYNRLSSEGPSYYMWRILDKGREPLRERLAAQAGVSPEEIAINRNASESLETIIFGLDLKAGDEVVVNKYDYPNMLNAWKQRQMREGIRLVYAETDIVSTDDEALAHAYISKFTSRTRVVHITHVINWNGQVLPVRRIAEAARDRGIRVLVDGAHAFAHLNHKVSDLLCDFWGTSLHKWLCAPIGSGMMYIRKELIPEVWPLLAPPEPRSGDIRKFEALGTRSFPIEQAIGHAL
ncbi:MAG: aminotransferase class V-fold PLP-dependent enzyme, partial [Flavobacteriales bacterium]|nr:aminotransferase class V-fold PLP-dependent enzyme [Flavobacteriales bacterium]MDW8410815.1 aminotransferase class V-fold PLP-dependent enzyme [Flavobacteriales bacterium]